ncbi:MAG: hypothetical protein P1V97_23360, partial [Planctomycetota bacterium]|nr:hypothetical protein [Planctomycetota bacterium]
NLEIENDNAKSIKAQAMLATAEAYFRLGKVDNCYQLLEKLPEKGLATAAQRSLESRLKLLSKKLRGTVELTVPANSPIIKSQDEKLIVVEQDESGPNSTTFKFSQVVLTQGELRLKACHNFSVPERTDQCGQLEIEDRQALFFVTQSGAVHVYQFESEIPVRLCKTRPHGSLKNTILFALGHANDNEYLDGVFRIRDKSVWFICLDIGSPGETVLHIPPMNGSWSGQLRFHDMNEDNREELIMGEGAWNTFALAIYKGFNGSQMEYPKKRKFGLVEYMSFNRLDDQKTELLITSERNSYYDVGIIFGTDLSPKIPDGIWSLKSGMDQPELILAKPFEQRDHSKFGIARRMGAFLSKEPDKLIYALQLEADRIYSLYFDFGGPNPLSIPDVNRSFDFIDFDHNGDQELFHSIHSTRDKSQTLKIMGLHTLTRKDVSAETNLDTALINVQLKLISTLLSGKQYQRALMLTGNLLEIQGLSKSLKLNLELNRARILLAKKDRQAARNSALMVAKSSSLLREESLRLAMNCADEMGDYRSALSDLDALLRSPTLTQANRQLLLVRQKAYQTLAQRVPLITFNKQSINAGTLPMVSEAPWSHNLDKTGVSFHSNKFSDSAFSIPIHYNGGSFHCSYSFQLKRVEKFTSFKVGMHEIAMDKPGYDLTNKAKNPKLNLWQIAVGTGGNGDIMTWDRSIGFTSKSSKIQSDGLIVAFPPGHIQIKATYRHDNGLLSLAVTRNGNVTRTASVVSPGLKPGDYQLHIMAVVEPLGRQFSRLPWSCEVSLEDFVLSGKEGNVTSAKLSNPLFSEAGMAVLRGDMAKAIEMYSKSLESKEEQSKRWEAAFGLGVALARSKRGDEARAIFAQLRSANGPVFRNLWQRWLYVLDDPELKEIARTEVLDANVVDVFNRSYLSKDFYKASLVSVLVAPGVLVTSPAFGHSWYQVGNLERAKKHLNSLANRNPSIVPATLGMIAFHSKDYPTAMKYWSEYDNWDGPSKRLVNPYRIRSIYLVNNPKRALESKYMRR